MIFMRAHLCAMQVVFSSKEYCDTIDDVGCQMHAHIPLPAITQTHVIMDETGCVVEPEKGGA